MAPAKPGTCDRRTHTHPESVQEAVRSRAESIIKASPPGSAGAAFMAASRRAAKERETETVGGKARL